MSNVSTVVVDVTSGLEEGTLALRAAAAATLELDVIDLVVVGDQDVITDQLGILRHDAERLRVLHAPDRLDRRLDPRAARAEAPASALAVGLDFVADHGTAAFVSAAHPAVLVLEALARLELLPTVRRAALAAVYPTLKHRGETEDPFALLLDVGATVRCEADDLVTFAGMGAAYARQISLVRRPRVAILSNSSRPETGPAVIREADARLKGDHEDLEYIGVIRADRLTLGEADVVVTDGFTGDVVIRTLESVVNTAEALLNRARDRFAWRVGVSMLGGGLDRLRQLIDWENYGGAPLLGLRQPVILTQDNSHERAMLNAIRLAAKVRRTEVIQEVERVVGAVAAG